MTAPVARWRALTIDALDPEAMAAFWGALLGTTVRARWEQYVSLQPLGDEPKLVFQRVDSVTEGKNALHLDLHVPDREQAAAAVERAVALGAHLIEKVEQAGEAWTVLADPEGNRFCVVAADD